LIGSSVASSYLFILFKNIRLSGEYNMLGEKYMNKMDCIEKTMKLQGILRTVQQKME